MQPATPPARPLRMRKSSDCSFRLGDCTGAFFKSLSGFNGDNNGGPSWDCGMLTFILEK